MGRRTKILDLPFDPADAEFNRKNALYLAHAADIAYHRRPARAARQRLGLETVAFCNKITRTRGFLGVAPDYAVLAYRGSDPITLPNWVTDAVVKLVTCDEYDGRVHHGFSSALRRTWGKIEPILERVGDRPLFITGHSMGGALAVLTACRLARAGRPPAATYTFGAPRVGDPAFCAGYSLATYRVVNRLDLVPELPLASVRNLLPEKPRLTNDAILTRLKKLADRMPCYGHVSTLVYLDRDGAACLGADVVPWRRQAVARAIATRGRSFHEGLTDHLISSYIRNLSPASERLRRSSTHPASPAADSKAGSGTATTRPTRSVL
ncbi:MAG: lipase family protein [Tepidisphaeraceae bacterium]